ncbi:4735_t:CDS:2, partial [Racocetra persica]
SIGNISSYLQSKHDLYENQNKTISEIFEQSKVIKMYKEAQNQEIQQAIA